MENKKKMHRRNFLQMASMTTGALMLSGCSKESTNPNREEKTSLTSSDLILRFNKNRTFKILQFTDTHWYDGTADDIKTEKLMSEIIQFENPDLIVLTGDVISGEDADSAHAQRDILTKLASHKTPWALVFGNHDDEGSCSRSRLWEIAASIPYSCCPKNVPNLSGVSNYVLDIRAAEEDESQYVLFMIDSNGYSTVEEFSDYGWIMPDQIEWFRKCSDQYKDHDNKKRLPSLLFFHIPIPEYADVVEKKKYVGQHNEKVCSPELNSGLFAAALEKNNVKGMFVGHDHVNDYEGQLAGIRLCYGRKTGFRSYSQEGFAKGARVIELTEGNEDFNTWVVIEGCRQIRYEA